MKASLTVLSKKLSLKFETSRATPIIDITKDEENILRYACGYIAMKLRERFLKVKGRKATQFVECLNKMQHMELDTDTPTTSFLAYTQEWIKKINRGSLFVTSDEVYRFFYYIRGGYKKKATTPPNCYSHHHFNKFASHQPPPL